jgi:hypothetical protein
MTIITEGFLLLAMLDNESQNGLKYVIFLPNVSLWQGIPRSFHGFERYRNILNKRSGNYDGIPEEEELFFLSFFFFFGRCSNDEE